MFLEFSKSHEILESSFWWIDALLTFPKIIQNVPLGDNDIVHSNKKLSRACATWYWLGIFLNSIVLSWGHGIHLCMFHASMKLFFSLFLSRKVCASQFDMMLKSYFINVQSLVARKIEVEDYKLLCVAKVEMKHQKFTLVGVLGGWWSWPPLSSAHEFIAFMDKLAFLAHRTKSILILG